MMRSLSKFPSYSIDRTITLTKQARVFAERSAGRAAGTTLKGCTITRAGAVYHRSIRNIKSKKKLKLTTSRLNPQTHSRVGLVLACKRQETTYTLRNNKHTRVCQGSIGPSLTSLIAKAGTIILLPSNQMSPKLFASPWLLCFSMFKSVKLFF